MFQASLLESFVHTEGEGDERGRRTTEGIAGWKLGAGESRGLENEGSQELGGHWESREETWNETRRKENDQKIRINDKLGLSSKRTEKVFRQNSR